MNYDVIVMGAGVAGTTAALCLRAMGKSVALVDRTDLLGEPSRKPEWITGPGLDLLGELGVDCGLLKLEPFTGLTFHSADLGKSADSEPKRPHASRVCYVQLLSHLRSQAAKAGIDHIEEAEPATSDAAEDHVTTRFGDREPIEGQFLVLADGATDPVHSAADHHNRWMVQARITAKSEVRDDRMHAVLGLSGGLSIATWWFDKSQAVLTLHLPSKREAVASHFQTFLTQIRERQLLPGKREVAEQDLTIRPEPSRLALEMDSHVDKRTVLIGDAGGFLSAVSREGLYPAIWSARLSAQVVSQAADDPHPQDVLRQFESLWRTTMGEYLRPPNTDLQFLLPLVFTNQQMADRLATAFWHGENI